MAKSLKNMMGAGIGAGTATLINGTVADGLTATGSNQADALILTSDVNVVSTVPVGAGVRLLAVPQPGDEVLISNLGTNTLLVYPPISGTIAGASANAPFNLPSGAASEFIARTGSANWVALSSGGAVAGIPVNSVLPKIIDGAGNTATAPIVGQRYFVDVGTWSQSPISYAWQAYDDAGALDASGTALATGDGNFVVQDAEVGHTLHVGVIANNGLTSLQSLSTATSSVTDIDLTNAITAFTRTSSSGVTPMTWGLTFTANVYEGYTLHAKVYSDSALTVQTQDVVHLLTNADLQSGATIDLTSDGLVAPGATDWLQLTVETTSPNGLYYGYTYGTALSPTDAVSAMTWSASDKVGATLFNSNLTVAQGSAPGGVRASRGVSSGKFYVEFIASSGQINLYDGTASLTTDQEAAINGGTPTTHAAVYSSNNSAANYNATTISATNFAGAPFTASISGTTMTVTGVNSGTLAVGQYIGGPSIPWGTTITALGTGAGGTGTYTLSNSITLSSTTWLVAGPIIGMAVDATNDKIWWAVSNTWINTGNPAAGTNGLSISGIGKPVYPEFAALFNGQACVIFPGTSGSTTGFAYTPPTGFVAP